MQDGPAGLFRSSSLLPIFNGAAGYVIFSHVVDANTNETSGLSLFIIQVFCSIVRIALQDTDRVYRGSPSPQASAFLASALPSDLNGLLVSISDVSVPSAPVVRARVILLGLEMLGLFSVRLHAVSHLVCSVNQLLYTNVNLGSNSSDPNAVAYFPTPVDPRGRYTCVVELPFYDVITWSLTFATTPAFEKASSSNRECVFEGVCVPRNLLCQL